MALCMSLSKNGPIQPGSTPQGPRKYEAPKSIFVILFFLEQPCISRGCLLHPKDDL
mgnify:CR=1 FL=1